MAAKRRRGRALDPLANPESVKWVFGQLREKLPTVVPSTETQLIKLLNAVRNIERRSATATRRGRPPRWKREELLTVASQLRAILLRETKGRISLNSFIGSYVRVLGFPNDVLEPLAAGEINLFEAGQLARVKEGKFGWSTSQAGLHRKELLRSHLLAKGSQTGLKARVDAHLGITRSSGEFERESALALVDDLIELDPYDSRHLFWEELRRIGFALRSVKLEDVDDPTLEEFLGVTGRLSAILDRIEKRGKQTNPRVVRL